MENVVDLTDDSFDEFTSSNGVCVVDFWAAWCGPCMMLAPIIGELAKEYAGKAAFGKLNIDENKGKADVHSVMSIPTLIFFKGGEKVDTVVGALPKDKIKAKIDSLL